MFKFRVIVLFICLLATYPLTAQDSSNDILCQVLDLKTKQPVVFATVSIKDRNNGVIADEEGYFRLPIKYKLQEDILIISCIGYETKVLDVLSLKDKIINTIALKPKLEALNAVSITTSKSSRKKNFLSAEEIVEKAINSMRSNYPRDSHSYIAYYRDYQVLDNAYVNLNEGILEVFDAGFQTNKIFHNNNQTALYSYARNSDFPRDSILALSYDHKSSKFIRNATISPLGGNELSILNVHNPIRNNSNNSFSFVYVFNDNFINNHNFGKVRKIYLDDTPIYEIKFFANDHVTGMKNSAEGTIYIAYDTFAIHKFEYSAYGVRKKNPILTVRLEYVPKGKKMYLNYISFTNRFQVRNRVSFAVKDVSFDASENAFFVEFNNPIKSGSIYDSKDFRFIYKKRKLKISLIQQINDKTIKIALINGTIPDQVNIDDSFVSEVTYKIKNVRDNTNRLLGKNSILHVNQFRELFVQEVFKQKKLPENLLYVNKKTNLNNSSINRSKDISDYWLNIPLKTTKE